MPTSQLSPFEAHAVAESMIRYRKDFRLFAREQLKLAGKPFEFWPCQIPLIESIERQMAARGFARVVWLKARQVGACLQPSTLVMLADLSWKSLENVKVGDELVSVEEESSFPPGRHLVKAVIQEKWNVYEPAFRLTLANGGTLVATSNHRFLSRKRGGTNTVWRSVSDTVVSDVIRFIAAPWGEPDYEDGWFGGFLDGEGSFRAKERAGLELCASQVSGRVFDRAVRYLEDRNYTFRIETDLREPGSSSKFGRKPVNKLILGRMGDIFKLLGQTRPSRWIGKDCWEGKTVPGRGYGTDTAWSEVVSIEPLGYKRMIDLQTSTKTFIAEGFVSHNSTLGAAIVAWRTMMWPNVNAIIIADQQERSKGLFEISKAFYEQMDEAVRPVGRYITKKEMVFANPSHLTRSTDPGLKSRIVVDSAHKKDIAIGANWQVALLSECARYKDHRFVLDGVIPAVHRVPGTILIMESSAEQAGLWFRDFAEESQRGKNAFEFAFVPWFLQPEYYLCPVCKKDGTSCTSRIHRETAVKLDLSAEERHTMTEFGITPGHVFWMREKLSELGNDWDLFRQSFPLTPEDAWVTPGAQAFPIKSIREQRDNVRGPERVCKIFAGPRLFDVPGGELYVWKEPKSGALYDIGADVSQGLGLNDGEEAGDASVACVIERGTGEQVAEWASKSTDPLEFATTLYWLGTYYNTAQIAIETNGIGGATNSQLTKMGYGNIYQWRYRDEIIPRISRKTGWETNRRTKPWLVGFATHELINRRTIVRSEALLKEMYDFVRVDESEWRAIAGSHDDRVIAWMIAILVSDDENFERYYGLRKATEASKDADNTPKFLPEPWQADLTFRKRGVDRIDAEWD